MLRCCGAVAHALQDEFSVPKQLYEFFPALLHTIEEANKDAPDVAHGLLDQVFEVFEEGIWMASSMHRVMNMLPLRILMQIVEDSKRSDLVRSLAVDCLQVRFCLARLKHALPLCRESVI